MSNEERSQEPELTLENWTEFVVEDLDLNDDERKWNRYIFLKQAEINAMLDVLPQLRKQNRVDSLCTANGDAGCDPVSEK